MTSSEDKLKDLQTETRHLKASLKKHENLLEKYKKKVESALTFLRLFSIVFLSSNKKTSLKSSTISSCFSMYFNMISSIAGPAASPGLRGKLPEAGGGTEGCARGEGESRQG